MRNHASSLTLLVCGLVALVIGLTTISSATTVSAQNPPPPRPAINPTADLDDKEIEPTAVIPGRLTGTVIDLRTGTPMSAIPIVVGQQTVYTDANGNYDAWLVSGYYELSLALTSTQGTPIQPKQMVAIGPGDTVVVHLFMTSPAPGQRGSGTPVPTPTTLAAVVNLPDTSVVQETNRPALRSDQLALPQGLPNTAAAAGLNSALTWFLFGALLIGVSLVVKLAPRTPQRFRLTRNRRSRKQRAINKDEQLLNHLLDDEV